MLQKNLFYILAFFGRFLPFDLIFLQIFWNLVCRYFPTKEKATWKLFFDFGIFGPFLSKKTAKIDLKGRKLAKSKSFDKFFWKLICWCFPTKIFLQKKLFFDFGNFWPFCWPKSSKNLLKKIKKIVKSIISPLKLFSFTLLI